MRHDATDATTHTPASRNDHLGYVDGLRAVAILAVIVYHGISESTWSFAWLSAPMSRNPTWWFATLGAKGAHGVDLFFAISGFCLSYPALARFRSGGPATFDLRGFFAKRIARIVPPYYAAIVFLLVGVALAAHFGLHRPSAVGLDLSPISILQQLVFFDRHADFVNSSFWTLAIELRWYVAFPFLLLLYVKSERTFFAVLVGCVVAFNFTQLRALDIGTLPGFMLGIVAADWQIRKHRFARFAIPGLLVALDAALLLEPFSSEPSRFGGADDVGFFVQTNIGWQIASFFFVVAAGSVAWLRTLLDVRALRAVGVCAYGIYLVHQPIISLWDRNAGPNANPFENLAITVSLALAGGFAFSFLGERPFLVTSARSRLMRLLDVPLARAFALVGFPNAIEFGPSSGARAVEAPPALSVVRSAGIRSVRP